MMEMEAEALSLPPSKAELESDYRLWLSYLLPEHFRSAGDEQFAEHHDRFFDWGWKIKRGVLPAKPAALWIVNRAGNKSTSAAGLAVALGAMEQRKFGLVLTRTEVQGDTHVGRVNDMLLGSRIGEVYPGMTQRSFRKIKLDSRKVALAWNRTVLTTGTGWTLQNFSLEAAQRGVGLGKYRPDFYWITDIDSERDGPGRVDTLLNALAAAGLGTASSDAVVIFDQNLIHRDSVLNRILTRKTDVLSNRVTIGPVPAVREPEYIRKSNQWFIPKGVPSWGGMNLKSCEAILNRVGMESWEREYQHNVYLAYPDAVYPMWDETYHVITRSEFAAYFKRFGVSCADEKGHFRIPERGKLANALDWGNNPGHPCAVRHVYRPAEGMPQEILRDVFFYREMCWPRFPLVEDDDRRHPSAMTVGAAIQDAEGAWEIKDRRMLWRISSHERPEIGRGFLMDLPLTGRQAMAFRPIDTARARRGILHMQNFLTIDYTRKHPFRVYPTGHPEAGKPLHGKPRVFFIAGNDPGCATCRALDYEQGSVYWDGTESKLKLRPSVDEHGQARTLFEYPNYRKPDTAQGTEKKDPPKRDDDIIDCDRAIAGDLFPTIQAMTFEERVEADIPAPFQKEAVEALKGTPEYNIAMEGRYQQEAMARHRAKQAQKNKSGLSIYEKARLYKS